MERRLADALRNLLHEAERMNANLGEMDINTIEADELLKEYDALKRREAE